MPTSLDMSQVPDDQRANPYVNAVIVKMPSVNALLDPLISGYNTPYTYTAGLGDVNRKLVRGAPSLLGALVISNNTSSQKIVAIFDKAAVPGSSDSPVLLIPVAANSTLTFPLSSGLRFSTGIAFSIMTSAGLTSLLGTALTAVLAGDVTVNMIYTS